MKNILLFSLIWGSQSFAQNTFEVDLDKVLKNTKAFVITEALDKQIRAKGPLTRMKNFEMKSQWKDCADLRNSALTAHTNLEGWIWTIAFGCELKAYDQDAKRIGKLKAIVLAFDSHLGLMDRGVWKKDLQIFWLKAHQILRANSAKSEDKIRWSRSLYQRPEFLTSEQEIEILRELQPAFAVTKSSQTPTQKMATVVSEPWWDAARKMDYEQVVKLLEEYFSKNEKPSNVLSARLIFGKAYLWTGRYDQAKTQFSKLQEEFPLSEEGVDAAFRLGLLHLRLGNPQLAVQTFDKLLDGGREKNPLTTRYWRLRALEAAGQTEAFETERSLIINQYPFTYFGLKLRVEAQQGRLEFPEIPLPEKRTTWVWPKTADAPWKRFLDLTKQGLLWEAGVELQELLTLADAEAYRMWSEFLADLRHDALAIRFAQNAQNMDERLVAWSFQKKFMPVVYQNVVMEQSEIHKVEPWMIWSIIRQESAFNPRAVSTSNAFGLMQLIGPTAQEVAADLKTTVLVPDELFSPKKNIPFGTRYLAKMKNEFGGHWPLGVAAYNAGPTRLKAWLKLRKDTETLTTSRSTEWRDEIWIDELPWNETQNYVKSVMRNFILYRLGSQSQWTLPPVFWSESNGQEGVSSKRFIEKKSISR